METRWYCDGFTFSQFGRERQPNPPFPRVLARCCAVTYGADSGDARVLIGLDASPAFEQYVAEMRTTWREASTIDWGPVHPEPGLDS